MKKILDNRNGIYGICALWIMLFHVYRNLGQPEALPVITPVLSIGNIGVDIFMFLSGYCLYLSFKRGGGLKRFYFKRMLRVIIPYIMIAVPGYLVKNTEISGGIDIHFKSFVMDITQYSYWTRNMQSTWFVAAIILCYILFPLFYRVIKKGRKCAVLLILALYAVNAAAYFITPLYKNCEITWLRIPVFAIGMEWAAYGGKYRAGQGIRLAAVLYAAAFAILPLRAVSDRFLGKENFELLMILYVTAIVPLMRIMAAVLARTDIVRRVFESLGSVSLEVYMIHIFMLQVLRRLHIFGHLSYAAYIIVPLMAWIIALLYKIPINYVSDRLFQKAEESKR